MSEYFSHDYSARNDFNMKKLFMKQGLAGLGAYWCIIEMLYEREGYIPLADIETIAFDLRVDERDIHSIITEFDLFDNDGINFFSNGVIKRLNVRNEKSEKLKKSANARWEKEQKQSEEMQMQSNCNANAMQMQSNCNANKIKIKEKENNNISLSLDACACAREDNFAEKFEEFLHKHSNIQSDSCNGYITEIDFDILDDEINRSEFLQSQTSLAWFIKQWNKIKSGYYRTFKKQSKKQDMSAYGQER